MRQLLVQVPRGRGREVMAMARSQAGINLAQFEAMGNDGPIDLVIIHVSNRQVEELLEALQKLPDLHVTLIPRGVIVLEPPSPEAPEQLKNVENRSPIEVFLSGLQSVGSWKGFLGYAVLAGIVVWIGLYTNTIYLLVAAMLIAPFAGPAMNLAIATARGDGQLVWRSLWRYFVALLVTISVAALLSLILGQNIPTQQMIAVSELSSVSVLLPLAAGMAGAWHLVQAERSSLVSGAAVGLLVAASLAPPAGLVGMASVLGRWDLVKSGLFVLLLQLAGINFTAALLFRIFGLSSRGVRYQRGKNWLTLVVLGGTVLALLGLLTWQLNNGPNLQRSSRAQQATVVVQNTIDRSGLAQVVEANVRFSRPDLPGQNTLLGVIYVQRQPGVTLRAAEISDRLTRQIQQQLRQQGFAVTPLIQITVLEPPSVPEVKPLNPGHVPASF